MFALGIRIGPDLLARQAAWFAPKDQPFFVPDHSVASFGSPVPHEGLAAEVRDTFEIYGTPDGMRCILLGEQEFNDLGRDVRVSLVRDQIRFGREVVPSVRSAPAGLRPLMSRQADGHRFVWWPSLLQEHQEAVRTRYLHLGRQRSRHLEVPGSVWKKAAALLPGARSLAGTFPSASGPNCFGTVMAAAGAVDAANTWMVQEPFEKWLAAAAVPGGNDSNAGTVLVWRSPGGVPSTLPSPLGADMPCTSHRKAG